MMGFFEEYYRLDLGRGLLRRVGDGCHRVEEKLLAIPVDLGGNHVGLEQVEKEHRIIRLHNRVIVCHDQTIT